MRKTFHSFNKQGILVPMSLMSFNEIQKRIEYGEHFCIRRTGWVTAIKQKIENLDPTRILQDAYREAKNKELVKIEEEISEKRQELAELRLVASKKKMPAIPHNEEYAKLFNLTFVKQEEQVDFKSQIEKYYETDESAFIEVAVNKLKRLPTDKLIVILKDVAKDHFYRVQRIPQKQE